MIKLTEEEIIDFVEAHTSNFLIGTAIKQLLEFENGIGNASEQYTINQTVLLLNKRVNKIIDQQEISLKKTGEVFFTKEEIDKLKKAHCKVN